jgi:hypothetical protein
MDSRKMKKWLPAGLCVVILSMILSSAQATDFYQWTDADGNLNFSDVRPEQLGPDGIKILVLPDHPLSIQTGGIPAPEAPEEAAAPESPAKPPEVQAVEIPLRPSSPKRFEVPYRDQEGNTKRVIIDVTFNDRVTAPVILDTGAHGLFLWGALPDRLGLKSGVLVGVGGITGDGLAVWTLVDKIQIGQFWESTLPARVVKDLSRVAQGLIGMDVLSNYKVTIDPRRKVVAFEEYRDEDSLYGGHDEVWWRNTFSNLHSMRDQWREYVGKVERQSFNLMSQAAVRTTQNQLAFARKQYDESERLLSDLDHRASALNVPRHWRR